MDQSLEELRAQRALIQQHLDWIDRKIAAVDPPKAKTLQPATAPQKATPLAVPAPANATTADNSPEESIDPEQILRAPQTMDIEKAKIGCVVIFALATFLFLFLLFGLPFLLD